MKILQCNEKIIANTGTELINDILNGLTIKTSKDVKNARCLFIDNTICGAKFGDHIYTARRSEYKDIISIVKLDLEGTLESAIVVPMHKFRQYNKSYLISFINAASYDLNESDKPSTYVDITGHWCSCEPLEYSELPKVILIG